MGELVISLSGEGLTTGEISAHLAEISDARVSKQTISTIAEKVVEGMAAWQNGRWMRWVRAAGPSV